MIFALIPWLLAAAPQTRSPTQMTLDVDASDAPMRILHAKASMPAKAGRRTRISSARRETTC